MSYEVRNNVEQGLYRFPTQFDNSPLLQTYLSVYLRSVDILQGNAEEVLEGLRINTATGVQLDNIGSLVGEERLAREDEAYRVAIKTRITLNVSQGTPKDISAAAKALSSSSKIRLWEHYPASVVVSVGNESFSSIPANIPSELDKAAAAGVSIDQVLIDTDADGLVFSEIILEQGTIQTQNGDDLINNEGDFIGYQLAFDNSLTGQSAFFSEIELIDLYSEQGDQFTLNGENWQVVKGLPDTATGNLFFEVLI